ncbi:MAG: helix-turn-helix transcriptional regulator [Planctomycetes bacterium]|nr:helix-turn-helix transcriptional regulator [Planctomycetota bacterium]
MSRARAPITIPTSLIQDRSTYRSVGATPLVGHISCGFQDKRGTTADVTDRIFPTYAACYVMRGRGTYTDWNGRIHPVGPGSLFQRIPGRRHTTILDPNSSFAECWIDFSGSICKSLSDLGIIDLQRAVLQPGLDLSLIRRLDRMVGPLRAADDHDLPKFYVALVEVLVSLYALDRGQDRGDEHARMIEEACRHLNETADGRIHLDEVARSFSMSYERFRKVFRERMGMSPGEYRIRRRIDRARELLLGNRHSVKEIAYALGYSNPYTFSSQFKDAVGLSPEAFRNHA